MHKATFILVHSAWLGAWSWEGVAQLLEQQGHKVVALDLPGHGQDKTLPGDIKLQHYVEKVLSEVDQLDEEVILVGHSFGGVTISQVAEHLPERIRGLVYLAAFMLPDGCAFIDAVSNIESFSTSVAVKNFALSSDQTTAHVETSVTHDAFAHDIPLENFNNASPHMVPEPARPLFEKLSLSESRFGTVPRYYIATTEDRAIPIQAQRHMIEKLPVKQEFTLASSHCPNFSQPAAVADCLQTIATTCMEPNSNLA